MAALLLTFLGKLLLSDHGCMGEGYRREARKWGFSDTDELLPREQLTLARMFHESLAATTDMAVLPGVLGCRLLRRTIQVRLGTNTLRLPGGTPIFAVSRQQFMKHPG